jgi:hypothetical protein
VVRCHRPRCRHLTGLALTPDESLRRGRRKPVAGALQWSWVAVAEGDEDPDERRVHRTRELQDEREWSFGRRRMATGRYSLAQPASAVPSGPCASHGTTSGSATPRRSPSLRACRDLRRSAREPAHGFAPDGLVETHRQAAMGRAHSAFAVCGAHLIDDGREVLGAGWSRAQALVDNLHGGRRANLHQLGRQTVHAHDNALGLPSVEDVQLDSVRDAPSS